MSNSQVPVTTLREERLLATSEPAKPLSTPLLTPSKPPAKATRSLQGVGRSLNLRVGLERYEWFHRIKWRLARSSNERALESMLAITELFLDSQQKPRDWRKDLDYFQLRLIEAKRLKRSQRCRVDYFQMRQEEERKKQEQARVTPSRVEEPFPEDVDGL